MEQDELDELMKEAKAPVDASFRSVISFDKETKKILKLAIPFTLSALTSSSLSNLCVVLIAHRVGTKPVAAYAVVGILVGLVDGVISGPYYACTTLCAQAVGAGNSYLAGQYLQIATTLYITLNIPCVFFWWHYMYEIILYLEWGDEDTALIAQDFIRVYIWYYILSGISSGVWQLLEVTDHVTEGTIISMTWSLVNVLVVWFLVTHDRHVTLVHVAYAFIGTGLLFNTFTYVLAESQGWLRPFHKGMFQNVAVWSNRHAVHKMLQQAVPISFGSLLSNAEWAILTFFASSLGPAEVAAWAILGSIWDVFYSVTGGIGDAAEIRCAYHFGDNHPTMAKLSSYKSLMLGMMVATVISILYFVLQDELPGWFTTDETLRKMLAELVPFIGVGNLTMTFGMQCWSLIGAQGRYKLATWISFFSSWGIAMPMGAFFVYVMRFDLQGLTSAVVVGYVTTGASLTYILLSTNWYKVAKKIKEQNAETSSGEQPNEDGTTENMYASMKHNSIAAKAKARRNIRLMTVPPGHRSGIVLGNMYRRTGTYVLVVRSWSPLHGKVRCGDSILALDGSDVSKSSALEISRRLKERKFEHREIAIVADGKDDDDDDEGGDGDGDGFLFEAIAEDETRDEDLMSGGPSPTMYREMEDYHHHYGQEEKDFPPFDARII